MAKEKLTLGKYDWECGRTSYETEVAISADASEIIAENTRYRTSEKLNHTWHTREKHTDVTRMPIDREALTDHLDKVHWAETGGIKALEKDREDLVILFNKLADTMREELAQVLGHPGTPDPLAMRLLKIVQKGYSDIASLEGSHREY